MAQLGEEVYVIEPARDDQIIAGLRQIVELQPEVWVNLDASERLRTLQEAENVIAAVQGRLATDIFSYDADPDDYGYFDGNTYRIGIGSQSLAHGAVDDVVDTLAHEGRHAYQDWAIDHPDAHDNLGEVEAWRHNFADDNYISPEADYAEYLLQPVEADSRRYARMIVDGLYGEGSNL